MVHPPQQDRRLTPRRIAEPIKVVIWTNEGEPTRIEATGEIEVLYMETSAAGERTLKKHRATPTRDTEVVVDPAKVEEIFDDVAADG